MLKSLYRTGSSFRGRYARQSQSELNIREYSLMRDQVIALEDETDSIIPVCVPVCILVFLGADTVNEKVAGCVLIESAEDVEHCRFAAA